LPGIDYQAIRNLYLNAPATKGVSVEWKAPDKDRLMSYLVDERSFSRDRVEAALARLKVERGPPAETLEKWFG
jgi:hypothetical protein